MLIFLVVDVWRVGVICRSAGFSRGSVHRRDGDVGSGWPGCGAEAGEGGGQVGGPGPVFVDLEVPAASGADEPGGHVQQSVAQRCWFASREFAVQAQRLGPGEQVGGGEGEFEPDLVLLIAAARYLESPSRCP